MIRRSQCFILPYIGWNAVEVLPGIAQEYWLLKYYLPKSCLLLTRIMLLSFWVATIAELPTKGAFFLFFFLIYDALLHRALNYGGGHGKKIAKLLYHYTLSSSHPNLVVRNSLFYSSTVLPSPPEAWVVYLYLGHPLHYFAILLLAVSPLALFSHLHIMAILGVSNNKYRVSLLKEIPEPAQV